MKKFYISSSWKNREKVRKIANKIRAIGHTVYDFTDKECRTEEEIPPEKFPELFDPDKHNYLEYLNSMPEYTKAVLGNYRAITDSDVIVLLLPCGNDAHSDWALGVGMGKDSVIVGHPNKGDRTPSHLWANKILNDIPSLIDYISKTYN